MICVSMGGRLGNQFFRYALARQMMILRGDNEPMLIDFSNVNKRHTSPNDGYEDSLRYFNTIDYSAINKEPLLTKGSLLQIMAYYLFAFSEKTGLMRNNDWHNMLDSVGIIIRNSHYQKLKRMPTSRNLFVRGQCLLPNTFSGIKDLLRKEFTPVAPPLDDNKYLYDVIRNTNSVCVSVRRGDYLSKEYKDDFFVCDENYYSRAFTEIRKHIKDPVLVFFSDDIEWVKSNIKVEGKAYYESGKDPVWETVRLMYSCKHFIISNSTFSWMTQYLCANENKIVISPNKYYNNKDWESVLLDDEGFIKIG